MPGGALYFDNGSVKGPYEARQVTVLVDYAEKQSRQQREVHSSQYFVIVDCVKRALVAKSESGYSGRMGGGTLLFVAIYNPRFQRPDWNPQQVRGVYDAVCRSQG